MKLENEDDNKDKKSDSDDNISNNDHSDSKESMNDNDQSPHKNDTKDNNDDVIEQEVFDRVNGLFLFDIYLLVVESLLHNSDNSKKDLTRDGDQQLFIQLLAEDDHDLRLIDISLPNQINDTNLNEKYVS